MNSLNITGTSATPQIVGDWESGTLSMKGDSYPENPLVFFNPVLDWVERYLSETDRPLHLKLELLYMNTSSIRAMMEILEMMDEAYEQKRDVSLVWYHATANERVAEVAEEFREDHAFPFEICSLEE